MVVFSKKKHEEVIGVLSARPEVCKDIQNNLIQIQQSAAQLKEVVVENGLSKFIIAGEAVNKLESSVEKGKRIVIFTSKFVLEGTSEFTKIIIRNFRKGVKYTYFVPDDEFAQRGLNTYLGMVKGWFNEFSSFVDSKEKAQELLKEAEYDNDWDQKYINLVNERIEAEKIKDKKRRQRRLVELKKC